MSYEELLCWLNYFDQRPIGWREDDRTFKLLQAQGCEVKPEAVFPSLAALRSQAQENRKEGSVNMNNLKGSMLFNKMLGAKGGERLDFDK